jgi:hypothetical protein
MMNKAAFAVLVFSSIANAGGLTLRSSDIYAPIQMVCNGVSYPEEIRPFNFIKNISWNALVDYAHSTTLRCEFNLDGDTPVNIATAEIDIDLMEDAGSVKEISVTPGFYYYVTPNRYEYAKRLGITLQGV